MTLYYSESTRGFYDDTLKNHAPIPSDADEITKEEHTRLLAEQSQGREIIKGQNGRIETRPRQVTPQDRTKSLVNAVHLHVDDYAQSQGFRSILDAISYADEPTEPTRQAQGIALRQWRSQCMVVLDQELQSDPLPQPPALIARLPAAP